MYPAPFSSRSTRTASSSESPAMYRREKAFTTGRGTSGSEREIR